MEKNIFSTFGGLVLFQDVVEVTEELVLVDPALIPGKGKLNSICSSNKQCGAQYKVQIK